MNQPAWYSADRILTCSAYFGRLTSFLVFVKLHVNNSLTHEQCSFKQIQN